MREIHLPYPWAIMVFFLLAFSFSSLWGAGENGIKVKTVETYPTFECIGLRVGFEGVADSNATAQVRYRLKGMNPWREAQPLGRIRGNRFAGSIFFLNPGSDYEVEITVTDQDGVSDGKKLLQASTRSDRFPVGGGKEYYVDLSGDDTGPGTAEKPFRTIQKAADLVSPGDIVWVMPGVYREEVKVVRPGRKNAYIAFMARKGGVILSGADPRYEGLERKGLWKPEGKSVYSTDPGFETRFVAADGIRLYHYVSLEEFEEFICGEPGGWFQDKASGRLYIRFIPENDPNEIPLQIARLDNGFLLRNADYILIEGFEIRDYGSKTGGAGVLLDGAAWCAVRNCSIHGMQAQVQLTGSRAEGNLVEYCEIWDTSIPRWPWAMTKGHDEEGAGIMSAGGRGNVVRECRMHGLFDGLAPSYWDKLQDESYNCDWDVYNNEIYDLRDDIMEPEGPCVNFRIWDNYCYDLFAGISLAPITVGPTYVLYNAARELKIKDIKYSGRDPGICYIYHNTFYSGVKMPHELINLHESFQAQVFRNNIFYANDCAFRCSRKPAPNNDLDYNDWYSYDIDWYKGYTGLKRPRLFSVAGKDLFTLKEVQETLGWEKHGLSADPLFIDPEAGNLRLKPGSPCIDKGEVLPNINDGFIGKAPDMGAYEWGSACQGPFPIGTRPRR